jgi:hypothetical protein
MAVQTAARSFFINFTWQAKVAIRIRGDNMKNKLPSSADIGRRRIEC